MLSAQSIQDYVRDIQNQRRNNVWGKYHVLEAPGFKKRKITNLVTSIEYR